MRLSVRRNSSDTALSAPDKFHRLVAAIGGRSLAHEFPQPEDRLHVPGLVAENEQSKLPVPAPLFSLSPSPGPPEFLEGLWCDRRKLPRLGPRISRIKARALDQRMQPLQKPRSAF